MAGLEKLRHARFALWVRDLSAHECYPWPGQSAKIGRFELTYVGPRMCPGRYLALAEIKMAAAMLLANFDIQSVATADGKDPREQIALTMYPLGLEMRLAVKTMPCQPPPLRQ